ncbi:MAG: sigma-54-dependent transcriptional regulator [Nitrospinota bacterium]
MTIKLPIGSKHSGTVANSDHQIQLLIVDDDETIRSTQEDFFNLNGINTHSVSTGEEALIKCSKENFDVILTDMKMPGMTGVELLKNLKERNNTAEIIILTGYGTVETAIEAIRAGAFSFLLKPTELSKLLLEIEKAANTSLLKQEIFVLKHSEAQKDPVFFEFKSPSMRETMDQLKLAARSESAILLLGESGVGKEVAANFIHINSPRRKNAFIKLHCAALSTGTLESELFGHEKGSFTGAISDREGRFELANGGTIFLDEISTISLNTQVKLLRVLQEKQLERVGGNKTIVVDFRLVTASNEDLQVLIDKDRFRRDLYFRVGVIPIRIPSLRDMRDDIPSLARFFINRFCISMGKPAKRISTDALKDLIAYSWPGNIRELQNVLERAVVLDNDDIISKDDLPTEITRTAVESDFDLINDQGLKEVMGQYEKYFLQKALEHNGYNVTQTAKHLKITRRNLQQKINRYSIKNTIS